MNETALVGIVLGVVSVVGWAIAAAFALKYWDVKDKYAESLRTISTTLAEVDQAHMHIVRLREQWTTPLSMPAGTGKHRRDEYDVIDERLAGRAS